MSYTLLDIKKGVAAQLGKTDYATANTVRDVKINDARREFYLARKWKFLKKDATLTFSSGAANWPEDYDPTHDLGEIYSYSGTEKTTYKEVALEDLAGYETDASLDFVYAIDYENQQFKSNHQSTSPTITYQYIPSDKAIDGTDDSDVEPAPDITPIIFLATAEYWLAAERDETNYDRFRKLYELELRRQKLKDARAGSPMQNAQYYQGYALGYNNG